MKLKEFSHEKLLNNDVLKENLVKFGNHVETKLLERVFLVADTQLYKRLCPSVRWSVGPLVRPSEVIELKSVKMSVFDIFFVCLSVGGGFGCGWGLDAPAHPSVTIL